MLVARLSLAQALWAGMIIFLPGDLMKIVLAFQVALKLPPKLMPF
ncbi:MAG: biotin transporter BioY [Elusimicrobia bacterium]|nr:biotin transporter BioY [Elusimicrobiota bacterium]